MDGKKVKLRLEHISQSYIVKNEVSDAVVDVSLDVYDNEFLVILGPGRCGKTVLLNMIAGLEKPVDGRIFLDGQEIHGSDERIGMVFQKLALMPWKTVMENVEFGLKMKGVPKAQRREVAQKYINLVGLQGFEKSYPSQLSGGMKQRVGIARAYTNNPEIMLMDEPFGQLDAQTRYSMQDEVLRIWESEKRTFIFVTNNIEEALYLADRIVLLTNYPAQVKEIYNIEPEAAACMQAQKIHMAQLRPADDQALLAFIAAAWEQTGAIHILVCDGRVAPVYKPLTEVTPEEWSCAIASTLRMNWKAVTAALPYMEGAELPAIVLITDPAVYHAGPLDGVAAVCAAGVESMTKTLASELASRHIRINAVAAPEQASELAGAVLFLASHGASYCTGTMLEAGSTGGWEAET